MKDLAGEMFGHLRKKKQKNIEKAGPIAYADYYVDNNKSIDEFRIRMDEILEDLDKGEAK